MQHSWCCLPATGPPGGGLVAGLRAGGSPPGIRWAELAIRRITDATGCDDPLASIRSRLRGYTGGDPTSPGAASPTGVRCWPRPRHPALRADHFGAGVSLCDEPALDVLAGWLASRIGQCGARSATSRSSGPATQTITLEPAAGRRDGNDEATARPDALLPLPRRETRECLAEDMRRLGRRRSTRALAGIEKVRYV